MQMNNQMNNDELENVDLQDASNRLTAALTEIGAHVEPNPLFTPDYGPGPVLAYVYPTYKWADGECLIAVYPAYVIKWFKNYPLANNDWMKCYEVEYQTFEEVIKLVRQFTLPLVAKCWLK